MSIIDDLLQAKRAEERSVPICLDFELAEKLAEAKNTYEAAQRASDHQPQDAELAARADDARATYESARDAAHARVATFTFRAVSPVEFDSLKAEHRPTEAQRIDARKKGDPPPEWNPNSFPPVLIAASCVLIKTPTGEDHGISLEDAQRLWNADNWNQAERAELFNAALSAHITRTRLVDIPKG